MPVSDQGAKQCKGRFWLLILQQRSYNMLLFNWCEIMCLVFNCIRVMFNQLSKKCETCSTFHLCHSNEERPQAIVICTRWKTPHALVCILSDKSWSNISLWLDKKTTDRKIDRQTDRQTDRTDPVGMGIYNMYLDGGTSAAGHRSTKAVAQHSDHSHGQF